MNLNKLGEECQKEIDRETLLNECIEVARKTSRNSLFAIYCHCPELYGPDGWCDECPVEDKCPSNKKDFTE